MGSNGINWFQFLKEIISSILYYEELTEKVKKKTCTR